MPFPQQWISGEKITALKLNAWNDALASFEKVSSTAAAALVASVGFGTANPQHPIHVNSTVASKGIRVDRNGNAIFSVYGDASGNGEMVLANSAGQNNVALRASGDSLLTGGRLGVGSGLSSILAAGMRVHSGSMAPPGSELGHVMITAVNAQNRLLLGLHQTSAMYGYIQAVENGVDQRPLALNPNGGFVSVGGVDPATRLDVHGAVTVRAATATPPNPGTSSEARIYVRNGRLIVQYNDAGTVRYKWLDLTGTGVTWQHSTSAP